jgi:hypothetical protein
MKKEIMEFRFGEKIYIRTPIESFNQFVKMMSYIQKSVHESYKEPLPTKR